MRVRLLVDLELGREMHPAGRVVTMTAREGRALVKQGVAVDADRREPAPAALELLEAVAVEPITLGDPEE
jgi:hypothetical protein